MNLSDMRFPGQLEADYGADVIRHALTNAHESSGPAGKYGRAHRARFRNRQKARERKCAQSGFYEVRVIVSLIACYRESTS
jgi:hypothetical protein